MIRPRKREEVYKEDAGGILISSCLGEQRQDTVGDVDRNDL
jgi:hypothetical protein